MDWLIKDPEAAKYSLTRHANDFEIDEKNASELRAILAAEGLQIEEVPEDADGDGEISINE